MAIPSVPHANYIEFRNFVNGRGFDVDGSFGYQCWDGVDLLYQQSDIGQYLYTRYYFDQSDLSYSGVRWCWLYNPARQLNGSGHFSEVTRIEDIKQGDIIVLDQYPSWYGSTGHIAFADSDYDGTNYINLLGQNQGAGDPHFGVPFNIVRSYIGPGAFLGAFRYDAWENPVPPTPTPTTTKWKKEKFPWPVAWNNWRVFKRKF